LVRDALDHPSNIPSKEWPPNTDLRRAPLLEAQVEIEIAAGDIDRARRAADEMAHVASLFLSKALSAGGDVARGRVLLAEGDASSASRAFESAAQQWSDIGAPYETAVARMGLAQALRAMGSEDRALLELDAARATFERIGADQQVARADQFRRDAQPAPSSAGAGSDAMFRSEGDYWTIGFAGQTSRLRDSRGLQYLGRLLGSPGREIHVLDLAGGAQAGPRAVGDAGDAGEVLDARAKAAYRRRLEEIDADIEQARTLGDIGRTAQAQSEREFLLSELSRAVGLGGRDRRAGAAAERARSAVTRAIRQALLRIRSDNPALGDHFDRTIRTGAYCVYLPDPRIAEHWML
jgi:tetratricopeptide (TPR) repeat protein